MAIVFLISLFNCCTVFAEQSDGEQLTDNIQSIIDGLDLEELQSYLDEYAGDILSSYGSNAKEVIEYLVKGDLGVNYSDYIGQLLSKIFDGVVSLVPVFAQIVAISILCSLCSGAEDGLLKKTTANTVRLACMSLIILILSSVIVGIMADTVESVERLRRQVEIIAPILITLTVLTGGSSAGAIFQPTAIFLSGGAIEILNGIIFPCTIAVIVLNFMSRLNPAMSFTGVASLIKSVMKWVIGITVAVFGIFLTVQSSASSLFNGIFFKITKYLVGNSVPIVGNFLSAGIDMIVMAGSIVRSSVGLFGVMLLIGEVIRPLVVIGAFSLMLKITGAIVQPLDGGKIHTLYFDLSKDVEYVIAGILMISFMYLIVIMAIANSIQSFI